jgi:sugar lactone lactonase YvrE
VLLGLIACLACLTPALLGQTAHYSGPAGENFGPVNVGASSANPIAMAFKFDTGGTLGSTAVVTQGATKLDFTDGGGGTCKANTVYNAGGTCTVNVTFKAKFPGLRYGAAELLDSSGNLLANGYVQGTGVGPMANFATRTSDAYLPGDEQTLLGRGISSGPFLAVDGSGNVYFADGPHGEVKEILAAGGYTLVKKLASGFFETSALTVDGAGNVFVADWLDSTGSGAGTVEEIVVAGGHNLIRTLGSKFFYPSGVAVDGSGNVFVADSYNSAVKEIVAVNGRIPASPTIKSLGNGFSFPNSVAVDGSGNVFVGDSGNNAVKEILAAGGYSETITLLNGSPVLPLALDGEGNIFVGVVGDSIPNTVEEILKAGGYTTVRALGAYPFPEAVAVDGSGNVYIGDEDGIVKLDYAEPPSLTFANSSPGIESSDSPLTVTVSNDGNADLTFPVPASGNNPALVGAAFTLDSATTCPELSSGSEAATLAPGTGCEYALDFTPTALTAYSGSLKLTDNSLNASPAVTQAILLAGTGIEPHLAFTTPPPSSLRAGLLPGTVVVSVEDSRNNVITTSSATVTLTVTGPNSYSKVYTAKASGGIATFSSLALLSTAGSYSYTATDTAAGLTQAVATESVWVPHLAFTTPPPSSLRAGRVPGAVAVSVEDPINGVITTSSATVMLTVTGPNSYSKAYTATASSGVATFGSLTSLSTAGTYSYTATETADGFTQAVATETVWAPHLAFSTPPPASLEVRQVPGTVAVIVENPSNIVITTSSATIKLTVTGPNSYSKVYTATASSGIATFSNVSSLSKAGTYSYTATDTADGFTQAVATESVWAPPPFGAVDGAVDSVTFSTTVGQSDSLKVSGWVADLLDGAPLSNVKVYVDGISIGTPTLGIARPDIAAKYNATAYLKCGYQLLYAASSLALGTHQATVVAIDSGGRSTTLGPRTFTVALTAGLGSPFGYLDQAVDSSTSTSTVSQADSLLVSGWVADPQDGAPLSKVKVYVDGNPIGTPTLGLSRPDIAAAYGSAYLDSGYRLLYAASSLALGTHQVTVVAIDSGGRSTTFGPRTITVAQ